jgi:hypothetical protein
MCGEMRGKRGDFYGHFRALKNTPHFVNLFFGLDRFGTFVAFASKNSFASAC